MQCLLNLQQDFYCKKSYTMIAITLTIDKADVLDEVGRLTGYTGSKKGAGDEVYARISSGDGDHAMLQPFWSAACAAVTEQFKPFLGSIASSYTKDNVEHDGYVANLEVSSSYDEHLTVSIEESLKNFFICLIASKWFKITDKEDAEGYALDSEGYMTDVMRKIYYRKKPTKRVR